MTDALEGYLEARRESPLHLSAEEEERAEADIGSRTTEGDEPLVEEIETLHLPTHQWIVLWGSAVLAVALLVTAAVFVARSGTKDYLLGHSATVKIPLGWSVAKYHNNAAANHGVFVANPRGDPSSAVIVRLLPYVQPGSPSAQLQWYLDHDAPELHGATVTSPVVTDVGPWGTAGSFDRDVYADFAASLSDGTQVVGDIQVLTGPAAASALCEGISTSASRFARIWPTFSTMVGGIRSS